jgi:hypothetical protein
MLNLNNEVFGFYQGSEQFPIQREYYSQTISGGLRWTSNSEVKGSMAGASRRNTIRSYDLIRYARDASENA